MKPMPRVLFLLFSLSVMTMMYVTKFGLYMDGQLRTDGRIEFSSKQPSDVDSGGNGKGKLEVQELKERIRMLEAILDISHEKAQNLSSQISHQSLIIRSLQEYRNNTALQNAASPSNYTLAVQDKLKNAEILHGVSLKTEYELIPFAKFTLSKIFLVEPGLGKRVVEKPIGSKRKDIVDVVLFAVE